MKINFKKGGGTIPAIIQDNTTGKVLMLGYLNRESYNKTIKDNKVTFYSRSKERLWTKGETSQNYLYVKDILFDCDRDTALIKVDPAGPTCHTGQDTCFGEENISQQNFLYQLEKIIEDRRQNPTPDSYTARLFKQGTKKIAQKVGEEANELVIEAVDDHIENFKNEAADLLYHLLVLLAEKNLRLKDIETVLEARHK
jgi:phosphoribosyl-ATP pyrophosphohydrolase/phosphoribosyl-AMP cyclohydrolase